MESPGGAGGAVLSGSNVPAFLTKLWTLVEDPVPNTVTDPLICWSPSGTSFHVFDQARFSKEVLPKFFKHSNMASFIRQLNMYGFRKVVHIEHGGLVKPERDDTEFQHPFFIRGEEHLLENIKRKVTNVSSVRQEEVKMSAHDVSQILSDVQLMKGKQETIDSRIIAMKHENEALWREMASLRQKHLQQQQVVNKVATATPVTLHPSRYTRHATSSRYTVVTLHRRHATPPRCTRHATPSRYTHHRYTSPALHQSPLHQSPLHQSTTTPVTTTMWLLSESVINSLSLQLIQFLVSLVQSNRIMGVKRKIPLMLNDSGSSHSMPKYSHPLSLEHMQAADSPVTSGPIISDITDVATPIGESLACDWNDVEESHIKEEPSIPVLEGGDTSVDTPLSPTTFINSILQETKPSLSTSITTPPPVLDFLFSGVSPLSAAPPPSAPPPSAPPPSAPGALSSGLQPLRCQTIACIDRSELSNHVDCIDSSLENLQSILNTQAFTFDPSPLMEFFSSSCSSGDFDLDCLDTLLSEDVLNGSESSNTNAGKQLVQYTPVPMSEPISSGEVVANLPSLLELEAGPFFTSDPPTDDPAAALLSHAHLDSDLS
ncbi:heat shock factor protein 1 isoform X2 [Pseudoliparis swirei]|uniref:heat shock factor protein 1 isoform X2 n=1 Tax=Pseudoliparis swirei TaxID=2059687 RepID=UPI0024BE15F9|nr:heat shock factor protein 1 isoform X2 [Pseudoliparis swirei]